MDANGRINVLKNPRKIPVMDNQECGLCSEKYCNPPFHMINYQYKGLNLTQLYYYVTKLPTTYPLDILICSSCCGKLITTYDFIEMCLQFHELLIKKLPQIKSENDTEDVQVQEDIVRINTIDRNYEDYEEATEGKMGSVTKDRVGRSTKRKRKNDGTNSTDQVIEYVVLYSGANDTTDTVDRYPVVEDATELKMGSFSKDRVYRSTKQKRNIEKTIIQPKNEPDDIDGDNLVYWGANETKDTDLTSEPPPLDSIATFTTAKQYSEPFSLHPEVDVDVKHFICSTCFYDFSTMEELELHTATHT